jgi:hypothetical protein
MARLYKGIGLGTHLHSVDLRRTGLTARVPHSLYNIDTVMHHVARGTITSCCISLTRSYGVAEDYALNGQILSPTAANPAFVYEIDIPHPPPSGMTVIDPVVEVAAGHSNPLVSPSYHRDGDMEFLLGVVDPAKLAAHLSVPIRTPRGTTPTPRQAILSLPLETFLRALRDAEILILNAIPSAHVIYRHDVY